MPSIPCMACEGTGYQITYEYTGLPEQDRCDYCKGTGKEEVTEEQRKNFWKHFKESDFK